MAHGEGGISLRQQRAPGVVGDDEVDVVGDAERPRKSLVQLFLVG